MLLGLAAVCLSIFLGFTSSLTAQQPRDIVLVAKLDGVLDGIVADYIEQSILDAENENALALVFQVNSSRSVISNSRLEKLANAITGSSVPIASWVGPSGGRAQNEVAQLLAITNPRGITPGARIGNTGKLGEWLDIDPQTAQAFSQLENQTVGHQEALDLNIATLQAPLLGDLLVSLDGFESKEIIDEDSGIVQLEPRTQVRFTRLTFLDQIMHAVASPPLAYLLFSFGLSLIVLEYFTAAIGVSGVIGAAAFILGCYGLVVLPVNLWAVALLLLGIFGYCIDIQTGVPRLWTFIGTASFVLGSIFLYTDGISLSWITLLAGTGGMLIWLAWALPILTRSRFTTPTIGREWMIGMDGNVIDDINPEGIVEVQRALWKARAARATPIRIGEKVKVTGLDNLILEVETQIK